MALALADRLRPRDRQALALQPLGERPAERRVVFDEQHARHHARLRQVERDGESRRIRRVAEPQVAVHALRRAAARRTGRRPCRSLADGCANGWPSASKTSADAPRPLSARSGTRHRRARASASTVHRRARRHGRRRSAGGCAARSKRAHVRDRARVAFDLTGQLGPVGRRARDARAQIDWLDEQAAVRLREVQRVLELELQSDACRAAVARGPDATPPPANPPADFPPAAARSAIAVFRSCVNAMKNASTARCRACSRRIADDERDAAGDEQADERGALRHEHALDLAQARGARSADLAEPARLPETEARATTTRATPSAASQTIASV